MGTATSERYRALKVALRREVLRRVEPAHVLDVFAGVGEMWTAAWHSADGYLGIDHRPWRSDEPHHRIISDSAKALARLDLAQYNVFDVDAFGEPWSRAIQIAERRRWGPGELGALVLTDGSGRNLRYGKSFAALDALIPQHPDLGLRDISRDVHPQAIAAWCKRSRVEPLWWAFGGGFTGGGGSQNMIYSATVFCGL